MQEIMKKRAGHYPQFPSAGSFFKNVPLAAWKKSVATLPAQFVEKRQIPAGWLIDQSGLKGLQIGGAMVSNEHGNFLINFKDATQADLLAVVEEVQARVYTNYAVHLEEEVHIIH
jgi:UDP-N-acetylmuramate dehydrogenase